MCISPHLLTQYSYLTTLNMNHFQKKKNKKQNDYYIPHNLLVLEAKDSKIINVHDECLKAAALFLSWGEGRGDEGGKKITEKSH